MKKNKEHVFSITRKDLDIQTFRCGGSGGQKVNKTSSGVRIIHKDSGAVGQSTSERSQHINKRIAFRRLVESQKFKLWMNKKIFELSIDMKELERQVNLMMREGNLKIEGKEDGKWVDINGE